MGKVFSLRLFERQCAYVNHCPILPVIHNQSSNMKNLIFGALALFVAQTMGQAQYTLTVESAPAVGEGGTLRGHDRRHGPHECGVWQRPAISVNTPDGAFNSTFNSSWNASGINPAFVPVFPEYRRHVCDHWIVRTCIHFRHCLADLPLLRMRTKRSRLTF